MRNIKIFSSESPQDIYINITSNISIRESPSFKISKPSPSTRGSSYFKPQISVCSDGTGTYVYVRRPYGKRIEFLESVTDGVFTFTPTEPTTYKIEKTNGVNSPCRWP